MSNTGKSMKRGRKNGVWSCKQSVKSRLVLDVALGEERVLLRRGELSVDGR